MQITINGNSYMFSENVLSQQDTRESYFELANTVFRLEFDNWHQSGYWDNKFIPYVLYDGSVAVASVGVCINDVVWKNMSKCYVQFSTVIGERTHFGVRSPNLNRSEYWSLFIRSAVIRKYIGEPTSGASASIAFRKLRYWKHH